MTFKCDFGRGVIGKMVIDDEPPLKGAPTFTALNTFAGPSWVDLFCGFGDSRNFVALRHL